MSTETELLIEIRDLLQVIAEPSLAKRDEKFREAIRRLVGNSPQKQAVVLLMNGLRTSAAIAKEAKMDQGNLSRLVKILAKETLIAVDEGHPKLLVKLPPNFFDKARTKHE